MSSSAGASSATAAIVVIRAKNFKRYLIACEYLQIEPNKVHELEYIKSRIETVRSQWNVSDGAEELKKLDKSLKWLINNYIRVTRNGFSIYKFVKRCDKLVHKGKLMIHEGSVNETYVKCRLSQINYDFYSKNIKRNVFIAICVILAFMLIMLLLGSFFVIS